MSPEDYIIQECDKFLALCKEINYEATWDFILEEICQLDEARDQAIKEKWPEGNPQELENSIAIQWGAVFSRMIANSYTSKWSVDAKTKTPTVTIKCGPVATQVQAMLLGAQAFNDGTLFADLANELVAHLSTQGAEEAVN
jgi:hypothetical protein